MSKNSPTKQKRVCIIMPAYNESFVIKNVINDIYKSFKSSNYSFEVVVVNDASTDETEIVIKSTKAVVINHILNSGAGGATSTGILYAKKNNFDIAVTMDSDGQHLALDAKKGIQILIEKNYDLLVGSRLINSDGMSKLKVIGNWGLSFATYLLFGVKMSDSQSGLKIFSKKAIDNLKWSSSGYEFCSEMLWRAKQQNLKIGEYPISAIYTDYSKSKGQNNWNGINIIKSLIKTRLKEFMR